VERERPGTGGGHLLLVEAVATFGFIVIISGVVRSGRSHTVAFAIGGYITAAYWFTSSTSFANPAIALARTRGWSGRCAAAHRSARRQSVLRGRRCVPSELRAESASVR